MLVRKDIAQLIADTMSLADNFVDVSMRVAIYPVGDSTIHDIVFKFNRERSIQCTSLELWRTELERGNMMGYHYFKLSRTSFYCSFYEQEAFVVFQIELTMCKNLLSVHDTTEVFDTTLTELCIFIVNM
jgi:hypothetical protein